MERQYPESAVRRAMKVQEVILKAIGGEIKWIQAADILGVSARTIRRMHAEYREHGVSGLMDKRSSRPSPRRIPYEEVERVLKLYRESYFDFNVQHFHDHLVRDYDFAYSYNWLRMTLQQAGLVKKKKGRGKHRKRRERRPLFGQMLHLDGSNHEWLSLCPGERQVLLLVVDDATGKNLAGDLVDAEATKTCLGIMRHVVEEYGIAAQLYTDRHSVYWHTAKAGGKVDKDNPTQFGRAMNELGIEMIPGYSPQARGRGERWNETWQDRLVSEMRLKGIDHIDEANRYIQNVFIPDMNRRFSVEPTNPQSAFVSARGADLDRIFAIRYEDRKVGMDNTVHANSLVFQIEKSRYRVSFTRCLVDVYEHLNGNYSIVWKGRVIGRYDPAGKILGLTHSGNPDGQLKKKGRTKRPAHPSSTRRGAPVAPQQSPILQTGKESVSQDV